MNEYREFAEALTKFIENSPSCFHVVENIKAELVKNDFVELREHQPWTIVPGGSYFVTRNGSSIIAFTIPEEIPDSFRIIAAHSDSPSFKIKENPEMQKEGHYIMLNTEKYGGMILAPWFDRPLSVAGRVIVNQGGRLETKLINIDRDLLMIPNLAIHMDHTINDGHKYQVQKELMPLFGSKDAEGRFDEIVMEAAGVGKTPHMFGAPGEIVAKDLFLYARTAPSFFGADEEFFASTKLDDLACAFAAYTALLSTQNTCDTSAVNMCCIFDNEEVGSSTKQGADSDFLKSVLARVAELIGLTGDAYHMAIARSFMVSADNAHAVHPNYPEKADPTNRPFLNGGVIIKYNANQKYTTDAVSAGVFTAICKKENVPVQTYFNNSDVAGGSTLGNISNSQVSMNTIDIGMPQFAMHSCYETAGVKDPLYMLDAMSAFYITDIDMDESGNFVVK